MENKIKISFKGEKVLKFFKKYGYYFILGIVGIGIALAVILTSLNSNSNLKQDDSIIEEPSVPTQGEKISFGVPVYNATVLKDYVSDTLVWNADLKKYETHKAIQITSDKDKNVYAVCDGKIVSITTNYLEGTKIVVEHKDGFKSIYSSLSQDVRVKLGQEIKKGSVLGVMSNSASQESSLGEHLHFELLKDNQKINPNDYISLANK